MPWYVDSDMLGTNQNVRNTPVSSRTTKLHNAISPSMNDQWSGNTLRRFLRAIVASPSRSSAQVAIAPARPVRRGVAAASRLDVATLLRSVLTCSPR